MDFHVVIPAIMSKRKIHTISSIMLPADPVLTPPALHSADPVSYSGGIAIMAGAVEPRVKAVVVPQVPSVTGTSTRKRLPAGCSGQDLR